VYTPHGGSLHYGSRTPQGMLYGFAERLLMRRTELFLFESAFARDAFALRIGTPDRLVRVVHNGVRADEFRTTQPAPGATDVLAIGELRHLKGIDVLIEALAALAAQGRKLTATIVGEGPDGGAFRTLAEQRGLADAVRFTGYQPAHQAFAAGRLLVVASRAESLPYIVLEAAAAGLPMVATSVGGIPEIFGPEGPLVPPGEPHSLAKAIAAALADPVAAQARAERLRERVRVLFSQETMVDGVLAAYREAIANEFLRSH
jgi:glycosyltransferase involved in cell wall biosynthesis